MKGLILDIELSPSLAAVWGLWNQNINITNLLGESEVLCWAAKWRGEDEIMFRSTFHDGKETMLYDIHNLLEEADYVVTYNGNRFDLKILNQEFLFYNMPPPKPYHSVDLLNTVRRRFRGTSNKLDWWLRRLGLETKVATGGPSLWIECMRGSKDAWSTMKAYNMADVDRTEQLLDRIQAWVPDMPTPEGTLESPRCSCGSCKVQRRGYKRTVSGLVYRQYQCQHCGRWFRERYVDKDQARPALVHVGQV